MIDIDIDNASDTEIMKMLRSVRPAQDNVGQDWTVEQSQAYVKNQQRGERGRTEYHLNSGTNNSSVYRTYTRFTASPTNVHVNYGSIVAGGDTTVNFTVTNALPGDFVSVDFTPDLPSGITYALGTVTNTSGNTAITLHNSNGVNTSLTNPTDLLITCCRG